MRLASVLLASLSLAACTGASPIGPDATIFCSKVIYDPCASEHDCADTECETVGTLQICTQTCSGAGDTSCPMDDGVAVACGSGGFCAPTAAQGCMINPP